MNAIVPTRDDGWRDWALSELEASMSQAGKRSLLRVPDWPDPCLGLDLVLLDATGGPTGSLKDWYVRDLFYDAILRRRLRRGMLVVDATSGSTGIAEAYWAKRLGLRFIAVMPTHITEAKRSLIRQYDGEIHLVSDPGTILEEAEHLADKRTALYLAQFPSAGLTPDWHGANSLVAIADRQMGRLRHSVPMSTFVPAGTGRCLTGFALHAGAHHRPTRVCVADFYESALCRAWRNESWRTGDRSATGMPSLAEGIARQQVEPGFDFGLMDDVVGVTDEEALVTLALLAELTGKSFGGSTGTVAYAAVSALREMRNQAQQGSVLAVCGDDGGRYADTLHSEAWRTREGIDTREATERVRRLVADLDDLRGR